MKLTSDKKKFCLAMQIYKLYVKLQFNLQSNSCHISDNPWEELQMALLSNRVKAVFLMSGQVNPNRFEPHLNERVPWWPPLYLPLDQFAFATGKMLTKEEEQERANAQSQVGTPVLSL